MSHYHYVWGRNIEAKGYPFYALIHAALRQADTDNLEKLKAAFPEVWDELQVRYLSRVGLRLSMTRDVR